MLLSHHVETKHSVVPVRGGGFGYLLNDRVLDVDEFLASLDRVTAGGSALDPEGISRVTGRTRWSRSPGCTRGSGEPECSLDVAVAASEADPDRVQSFRRLLDARELAVGD